MKHSTKKQKTHGPPQSATQKLNFCQTRNTSNFKLDYVKVFLRKFRSQCLKNKQKFKATLNIAFWGQL